MNKFQLRFNWSLFLRVKLSLFWPGDKPLSEPMMVSLPTHIYVTRPQWVKKLFYHIDTMFNLLNYIHWYTWFIWKWQQYFRADDLKYLANQLFVDGKLFNNKYLIKVAHYWPLVSRIYLWAVVSPFKGPVICKVSPYLSAIIELNSFR